MQIVALHPEVIVMYSEKADGNMDKRFSPPEIYKSNRKEFFRHLRINQHQLIEGQQVHHDRILKLDGENIKMWGGQNITGVDGFITNQSHIYLMVRVADCVPLVIFDPQKHVLALVHAGYKGTVKGIHVKALERLVKEYQAEPKNCLVWFGPSVRDHQYYVDAEPETKPDPVWKHFIKKNHDQWQIDLVGYQQETLKTAGVLKKNMKVDPRSTLTDDKLFSHLKSKATNVPQGRFAVLCKIK